MLRRKHLREHHPTYDVVNDDHSSVDEVYHADGGNNDEKTDDQIQNNRNRKNKKKKNKRHKKSRTRNKSLLSLGRNTLHLFNSPEFRMIYLRVSIVFSFVFLYVAYFYILQQPQQKQPTQNLRTSSIFSSDSVSLTFDNDNNNRRDGSLLPFSAKNLNGTLISDDNNNSSHKKDYQQHQQNKLYHSAFVDERLNCDAYGLHTLFSTYYNKDSNNKNNIDSSSQEYHDASKRLRDTFSKRYGGEYEARYMLIRGISTFERNNISGNISDTHKKNNSNDDGTIDSTLKTILQKNKIPHSLYYTAQRFLLHYYKYHHKIQSTSTLNKTTRYNNNNNLTRIIEEEEEEEENVFQMSFGGYSVTAGRGNYFHQSYPFVLERLLQKPFHAFMNIGLLEESNNNSNDKNDTKVRQEVESINRKNNTINSNGNIADLDIHNDEDYSHFQNKNYSLKVRNAAIGGVPSFPYGWCFTNFWGGNNNKQSNHKHKKPSTPDVVSWDYSMNEPDGISDAFEAYVRHVLKLNEDEQSNPLYNRKKTSPMLIVKDTHIAHDRRSILQKYVNDHYSQETTNNDATATSSLSSPSLLKDPIVIHTDPAIQPYFSSFYASASSTSEELPYGFQNWREFGSPQGAPGRVQHHPAKKEHELIGYMLAMHFLAAIELAVFIILYPSARGDSDGGATEGSSSRSVNLEYLERILADVYYEDTSRRTSSSLTLPPPFSNLNEVTNNTNIVSLLYGQPIQSSSSNKSSSSRWKLNNIQCATTFQPILQNPLSNYIIQGTSNYISENKLRWNQVRGPMLYNNNHKGGGGWVYDLSESERKAKRSLEKYKDGLGFIDSKFGYYGIKNSGALGVFLPVQEKEGNDTNKYTTVISNSSNTSASEYIKSIVICEVNEKRFSTENVCHLSRDISVNVGGVLIEAHPTNDEGEAHERVEQLLQEKGDGDVDKDNDTFDNEDIDDNSYIQPIETTGTSYLGKQLCVLVKVPSKARLTRMKKKITTSSFNAIREERTSESKWNDIDEDNNDDPKNNVDFSETVTTALGLRLDVQVTNSEISLNNNNNKSNGGVPCSISHVVWELNE